MEDTHKCIDSVTDVAHKYNKLAYYAVFDGHGGDQTAKMVQDALHPKIFQSPEFTAGHIEQALKQGFEAMDKEVVEAANLENAMHGCTGVVCLVADSTLYVANIGDSEAILVSVSDSGVSSQNMTTPHKASDQKEKERIEALGGHVFFGRVFGALAVSRSFGDAKYKIPKTSANFVSFEPAIKTETLCPSHKYLILACDGLWDVVNHQDAATMCHEAFASGKNTNEVAKVLVETALKKRTEDNVTVVVVKIDWPEGETPTPTPTTQTPTPESTLKEPAPVVNPSESSTNVNSPSESGPTVPEATPPAVLPVGEEKAST